MTIKPIFLGLFCLILGFLTLGVVLAQDSNLGPPRASWSAWILEGLKGFLGRTFAYIIDSARGLADRLEEQVFKTGWEWLKSRGQAIKQGIEEEKQELEQANPLRFFQNFWQKLKEGVYTIFTFSFGVFFIPG